MGSYYATSVTDVWKRLGELKPYVRSRDIELLLEYREQHELYRKELIQCKEETRSIKLILQTMNPSFTTTESSLEHLAKLSLPHAASSDMVNMIYHIAMINKILTLAVEDGLNKAENLSKITIPRGKYSTPPFYNIMKNIKREKLDVEKDLVHATKLWLWVKKQSETAMKQSASQECTKTKAGTPKKKTAPTTTKPPHHSSSGGGTFQCHLLLNRYAASSNISSPEYKKLTTLEDKLKYILDELAGYEKDVPRATNGVKKSAQKQPETPQPETEDAGVNNSVKREEGSSKKAKAPTVNISSAEETKESRDQPAAGEVVLSSEPSAKDSLERPQTVEPCPSCKKRYIENLCNENLSGPSNGKPLTDLHGNVISMPQPTNVVQKPPQKRQEKPQTEIKNDDLKSSAERKERSYQTSPEPLMDVPSSTEISKVMVADGQLYFTNPLPAKNPAENHNGNIIPEEATDSVPADDIKEQSASETAHQDVLTEKNLSNDETPGHRPVEMDRGRAGIPKISSVPVELCQMVAQLPLQRPEPNSGGYTLKRSCSVPGARRTSLTVEYEEITLLPNMCREPIPNVGRSGRTRISSPKQYAVITRNGRMRRLHKVDPEKATQEELLGGDDVPDVPEDPDEYRSFNRPVMSSDSVRNIISTVSSKLDLGQWKELFKKLMYELTNPTQITEDICGILGKHLDDERQAAKSLELWRQANGSFDIDVLLDALTDIRRRDIVSDVQKYISRLNQANAKQAL